MNTLKRSILTAITMGGAFVATSHAQTFNLIPTGDTFIRNGSPDSNNGSSETIGVTNDGSTAQPKLKDEIGLLKFDLSSLNQPVSNASLFLSGGGTFDFELYAIHDLGTDEDFEESTLTFNTFSYSKNMIPNPTEDQGIKDENAANDGSINTDEFAFIASFSGGSEVNISSSALVDFINADTNGIVTFVLYRTTGSGTPSSFVSKEGAEGLRPQLTLNTIPEPSDFALMAGVLGLFFVVRRRRKTA